MAGVDVLNGSGWEDRSEVQVESCNMSAKIRLVNKSTR